MHFVSCISRSSAQLTYISSEHSSAILSTNQLPILSVVKIRGFPPAIMSRKKSLLIGINYEGSQNELRGCRQDVENVAEFLSYRGYSDDPHSQVILRDDLGGQYYPTGHNILVLHFSLPVYQFLANKHRRQSTGLSVNLEPATSSTIPDMEAKSAIRLATVPPVFSTQSAL